MVGFVGFAGGEDAVVFGWRSVCKGAKEGMRILHQQQVNAFLCVFRQTVAGFNGVVQRIAKNDTKVFGIEGQAFLNTKLCVKDDTLAFGKGFFLC